MILILLLHLAILTDYDLALEDVAASSSFSSELNIMCEFTSPSLKIFHANLIGEHL